jgi:hypothetical protein
LALGELWVMSDTDIFLSMIFLVRIHTRCNQNPEETGLLQRKYSVSCKGEDIVGIARTKIKRHKRA